MPRRPLRRAATALALVTASLALAGCFSVESNITINDDGTADVELVTLIDTEQLAELGNMLGQDTGLLDELSGEDLLNELTEGDDPCGDLGSSFTDYEVSTREIDNGTEVGVGCIVEGVPIDELNSIGPDSSFTIEQDGSGTRFSAVLQGVEELTAGAEDLPLPGIDFDELFSIVFTATGPGSLGDNNATSTDGSTATWAITADASFVEGGDATMTAEWTPGGGSDNSWLIPLLVVVGLVLIGLIAFLLLRRKGQSPEPAEHTAGVSAVPPPPPGAVDTPPAPHPPTDAPPVASSPPPPPAPAPTAPPVSAPPPPPASSPPPPPPPPAEPPPPPPPTA
ncbi:MAG: hypothetical protein WBL31_05860 [Ilumatobacteraceae bacterium]|jgi:hypothetical protein